MISARKILRLVLGWRRKKAKTPAAAARVIERRAPVDPPPQPKRSSAEDRERVRAMLAESDDDRVPVGAAESMPFDMTIPADLEALLPKTRR